MQAKKLITIIDDYINFLSSSGVPNAKFRIIAWKKIHKLVSKMKTVTQKSINSMDITDYMKATLSKVIKTGKLDIEGYEKKSSDKLYKKLIDIAGIGSEKANELIAAGVKKISDLRKSKFMKMLNTDTQTYLKYPPKKRIKHSDIIKIDNFLKQHLNNFVIAGSYRRKKAYSSDIDLVIVKGLKPTLNTLKGVMTIYPYAIGGNKASIIIDAQKIVPGRGSIYMKMDIFSVKKKEFIPMLLYATGSAAHNIKMRKIAKSKNLILNQTGLYDRKTNKKIPNLKTEQDYFKALDMQYKLPMDRE